MLLSYGGLPSKLISNLLNELAKKMDFSTKEEIDDVIKKVFEYMREVNCKGRRILEGFMERIKNIYKSKHVVPIRRTRNVTPPEDVFKEIYNRHLKLKCHEILNQNFVPKKLDYLLEGYSQIESLINEVDLVLHLFKHDCTDELNPGNFFIYVAQLIEVLEYEIEIFNKTV